MRDERMPGQCAPGGRALGLVARVGSRRRSDGARGLFANGLGQHAVRLGEDGLRIAECGKQGTQCRSRQRVCCAERKPCLKARRRHRLCGHRYRPSRSGLRARECRDKIFTIRNTSNVADAWVRDRCERREGARGSAYLPCPAVAAPAGQTAYGNPANSITRVAAASQRLLTPWLY